MQNKEILKDRLDDLTLRLKAQEKDIETDNFLFLIYTCDMILNYLESELRKLGLNRTQIGILTSLVRSDGIMMPTQLSRMILRSKYATIKAIDSLERLKLTKSERSKLNSKVKSDRRLRKVTITEKGLEILESTMADRRQLGSKVLGDMDENELDELKSVLNHLRNNLLALKE
jgi:DNA-binding MarR family transcriptional regulator